jgi:uncharacterized membrane protein YfcA
MADAALWMLLAGVAFVAATLAAVTGFGGAAVLLPVLVLAFGVRDAIPIRTMAQSGAALLATKGSWQVETDRRC